MTIAAGFRIADGVLIWADTEFSGTGVKSHASKIIPAMGYSVPECSAVFSFAGDNANLALAAVQKCAQAIREQSAALKRHGEIAALVEKVLSAEYRMHVSPTPKPDDGSLYQIIFAAHGPEDGSALYSSWQGTIVEHDTYECIGIGEYLGRVLIGPMFNGGMGLEEATMVAAFVAAKVKDHVSNVSGGTNLTFLSDTGTIKGTSWSRTRELEDNLRFFDSQVRTILFKLFSSTDEQFVESLALFGEELKDLRLRLGLAEKSKRKMNLWPTW